MEKFITITSLLAGVSNILLGFFVWTKNPRKGLHRSFALFAVVTGIWVLSNFFLRLIVDYYLFRLTFALGAIVPPTLALWLFYFRGQFLKSTKIILLVLSLFGAFFFIASFSDDLVVSGALQTTSPFEPFQQGRLFYVYAAYLSLNILIPLYISLALWRNFYGIKKEQAKYIFLGLLLFSIGPLLFSIILPVFGIEKYSSLDSQFSFFFVISSVYAIIRHRLLDIRLVITRSLIYGILLTLVTLSFVFITFLSAQFFGETTAGRAFVSFIVAALIVFGLDPLKRGLSVATDKIFFKAKIDYQTVLRRLTEVLSVEIDIDRLMENLTKTLAEELKIKNAIILPRVQDRGLDVFEVRTEQHPHTPPLRVAVESPLMAFIREHKHPSLLEALERKIEDTPEDKRQPLEASRTEFERLGAALVAPAFAQERMNAILVLGPKLSGETFSNDDLQLVEVLGPQIGSAIQKSNLYEEVREFGERLKERVEEATEELTERNVSLVTLQQITKDITRTLDFNKVVQNIADAVATELGFVGAILVFLDDDGKTLRARAITNTPLTSKAMKLLPKPFNEYVTDITNPQQHNLAHDVITTGETRFSEDFSEVVCPPLPKILAAGIQKLIKLKSIVVVPIVSEEKVIGAIEVGARRSQAEISEREIETIKSMADELGIVARNLRLFGQIQKANRDLEEANKHLQQLDQAKSEFVSIASHQLRTPMTGIMGYLSMLVSGDFGTIDPKHLEILKNLLDESQRMIRLINLFLNVSKIEAGKFTITKAEARLEHIIDREVDELKKAAEDKGLKLRFIRPSAPLPRLFIDADKIQDVLLNLIDNGIKYTTKGSVSIRAEADEHGVTVHVKDTGIGIKSEDIAELFNKFVRASGIARIHPDGSGLGLFIAKSIVEGHAGRIWVESEGEGKGSTFSFWLPIGGAPGTTTLKEKL